MINILYKYDGLEIYPLAQEQSLNIRTFPQTTKEYTFLAYFHCFFIIIKNYTEFNYFDEQINYAFKYLFIFLFCITEIEERIADLNSEQYKKYGYYSY